MKYLVCLFILVSSSVYADGIYKWVDEDGNTHYGDIPPPSVHTEELRVDVAPSDTGKALPRLGTGDPETGTPKSGTSESGSTDSAQPDSEISDDQAETICKEAHRERKILNNSKRRSRIRNPDGSYRLMNIEERKAHRKQSDQDIEEFCK